MADIAEKKRPYEDDKHNSSNKLQKRDVDSTKVDTISVPTSNEDHKETTGSHSSHPIFPDGQLISIDEIETVTNTTQMKINQFIKSILKLWESTVTPSMPDYEDKMSLLIDTKKSLFPLCVQLRKSTVSQSIQISLLSIFLHIQRFEFREATQSYLKLSIGNVAWPIGVVNVSIHSRSNQSRLHGKEEANIMISEEVRKWITAVKRMITFLESYYKAHKNEFEEYVRKMKEADQKK